jgi:hypothetical protein
MVGYERGGRSCLQRSAVTLLRLPELQSMFLPRPLLPACSAMLLPKAHPPQSPHPPPRQEKAAKEHAKLIAKVIKECGNKEALPPPPIPPPPLHHHTYSPFPTPQSIPLL